LCMSYKLKFVKCYLINIGIAAYPKIFHINSMFMDPCIVIEIVYK
jgi:hypothetical protein